MTDRTVKVKLKGDISDFNRAVLSGSASARAFTDSLDDSSDRMGNLVQTSLALGPALVPVGAVAVPAVAGLANQLGIATAAAGVFVLAFNGIGDALKATNDYALEPSAANFEKLQASLRTLGPEGREFVSFLQELRPEMQEIRKLSEAGLLPGVEAGLTDLMDLAPQAERIVSTVATTLGELVAEAGDNLNDKRWRDFFEFIENDARPTLLDMGRTVGNFAEGLANLWMAFDPLSQNFSRSFLGLSRDFAAWTDGLDKTEGFQEFVDYINENGPRAWDALTAVANALLQIVEAAAPVGSAALPVIEAVADGIATLADSDLGPVIIGVVSLTSALSRLRALGTAANGSAIGGLFGKAPYGGGLSNIKAAAAATDELRIARSRLAASATSARDAQFALIPTSAKRQELASYMTNLRSVSEAEKGLAAARKARNSQLRAGVAGAAGLGVVLSGLDEKIGLSNTATLGLAGSMAGPLGTAVGATIGATMDLANANDGLWEAVNRANTVLSTQGASLADQSAAVDEARKKVDDLRESLNGGHDTGIGDDLKIIKNEFEGLFGRSDLEEANSALADLEAQQKKNAIAAMEQQFAEAGMSGAMSTASARTREQTSAILDLIAEHNALTDATLASSDANIAYEQALDDAAKAGREGKDGLDANTQVGRDNLTLLNRLAGGWNNLSAEQQNAKGASQRARAEFIAIAIQMGATKKEAKKLADEYLDIPTKVSTNIKSNAPTITAQVRNLIKALEDIPGLTETTIRTIKDTYLVTHDAPRNSSIEEMLHPADGGYIRGPGGPRDDAIPAMVSNGEFVVNAAATADNLELLFALNSKKYADGGYVGPSRLQRMAPGLPGPAAVTTPANLSASIVGARVVLDKDGLMTFVDGRVEIGVSQANDYSRKAS